MKYHRSKDSMHCIEEILREKTRKKKKIRNKGEN